jgi:hypothetical protein
MATRNDFHESKYLRASDLDGEAVVVTIKVAPLEVLKGFDGKEQKKIVCYFSKRFKPLPLNLTNYDTIANFLGDESDNWAGSKIELYPTTVAMNGKSFEAVRVRKPAAPKAKAKPEPEAPPDMDDEIPL